MDASSELYKWSALYSAPRINGLQRRSYEYVYVNMTNGFELFVSHYSLDKKTRKNGDHS